MPTLEHVTEVRAHQGHCTTVRFSPAGTDLLTGGFDPYVRVWKTTDWSLASELVAHEKGITSYTFTPDGSTLLSASSDKSVKLWEWPRLSLVRTLEGHRHTVTTAAVAPNGTWIATASYDATVRLWPLGRAAEAPIALRGHSKNVGSVAFSPDGRMLASAGVGGDVLLWDVESGKLMRRLEGHRDAVLVISFDLFPGSFCSIGYEGTIIIRDTDGDWAVQRTTVLGTRAPSSIAQVPGKALLFTGREHTVSVLSLETFEEVARESVPTKGVYGVAVSPDGTLAACAAADGRFRVWRIAGA